MLQPASIIILIFGSLCDKCQQYFERHYELIHAMFKRFHLTRNHVLAIPVT